MNPPPFFYSQIPFALTPKHGNKGKKNSVTYRNAAPVLF